MKQNKKRQALERPAKGERVPGGRGTPRRGGHPDQRGQGDREHGRRPAAGNIGEVPGHVDEDLHALVAGRDRPDEQSPDPGQQPPAGAGRRRHERVQRDE
ncbi:MAG: hypothetical protein BJ554DRAFT_7092 [Olpidium bornovanus]|uniref:Uncharacterized protein n=1 Tax=Olpidium bornovanus TaxID=278681 RepID=A0A8H7ZWN0_9FUNG|nr:MAG: hypothetical protein BJ554DRAFT_7092 [Olpidium bornovanus]